MASATNDRKTTEQFADLLYKISDDAGVDLSIDDAAEAGWLVREGEALLVQDFDGDVEYLATVQKVVR